MEPILSIITINRNNAKGLRKTIESVVTQHTDDFEYIIIDGASADESVDIIREYKAHPVYGKKISYWISEPDTGIYNAMNKGLRRALKGICDLHKSAPNSILYGALKTYRNGIFQSVWGWNADTLPQQMVPHLATFVPKAVYETYGYFDETYRIAGDYEAFLRFYKQGVDFQFLDRIVCNFNLEGISENMTFATQSEAERVQKKYGVYIPPPYKRRIVMLIKKMMKMMKRF